MKNYIIVIVFIMCCLLSCTKERVSATVTFDASKDTTFIVERHAQTPTSMKYNIQGHLDNKALLIITYYKSEVKGNENVKLEIPLDSGKVSINDKYWDFYDNTYHALITFKHLKNNKGKLTVNTAL